MSYSTRATRSLGPAAAAPALALVLSLAPAACGGADDAPTAPTPTAPAASADDSRAAVPRARVPTAYRAIDVPTPAGQSSFATALNRRGQVAGVLVAAGGNPFRGGTGFLWSPRRGRTDLPLPPGALGAFPTALDDRGEVMGDFALPPEGDFSVSGLFHWSAREGLTIPVARSYFCFVTGLNDPGTGLVTCNRELDGAGGGTWIWLWHEPTGDWTRLFDVSEGGSGTGIVDDGAISVSGEFLGGRGASGASFWSPSTGRIELTPDDLQACEYTHGLNIRHQVLVSRTECAGNEQSWIVTPDLRRTPVPPLPGFAQVVAEDINDAGLVLARAYDDDDWSAGRHYLWSEATGVVDLAPLIGEGSIPIALDERGLIAGHRPLADGRWQATLWVPQFGRKERPGHPRGHPRGRPTASAMVAEDGGTSVGADVAACAREVRAAGGVVSARAVTRCLSTGR